MARGEQAAAGRGSGRQGPCLLKHRRRGEAPMPRGGPEPAGPHPTRARQQSRLAEQSSNRAEQQSSRAAEQSLPGEHAMRRERRPPGTMPRNARARARAPPCARIPPAPRLHHARRGPPGQDQLSPSSRRGPPGSCTAPPAASLLHRASARQHHASSTWPAPLRPQQHLLPHALHEGGKAPVQP
jgi:hypothetical protein